MERWYIITLATGFITLVEGTKEDARQKLNSLLKTGVVAMAVPQSAIVLAGI